MLMSVIFLFQSPFFTFLHCLVHLHVQSLTFLLHLLSHFLFVCSSVLSITSFSCPCLSLFRHSLTLLYTCSLSPLSSPISASFSLLPLSSLFYLYAFLIYPSVLSCTPSPCSSSHFLQQLFFTCLHIFPYFIFFSFSCLYPLLIHRCLYHSLSSLLCSSSHLSMSPFPYLSA